MGIPATGTCCYALDSTIQQWLGNTHAYHMAKNPAHNPAQLQQLHGDSFSDLTI